MLTVVLQPLLTLVYFKQYLNMQFYAVYQNIVWIIARMVELEDTPDSKGVSYEKCIGSRENQQPGGSW